MDKAESPMKTTRQEKSSEAGRVNLEDNVAIVLFRPQIAENVGAAARAACNMGIEHLHLVEPHSLDLKQARIVATQAAAHLLDSMVVHRDLAQALGPFQYVVGTTARLGGIRKELRSPREMATGLDRPVPPQPDRPAVRPGKLRPHQPGTAPVPRPGDHPHGGLHLPEPRPGSDGHGL